MVFSRLELWKTLLLAWKLPFSKFQGELGAWRVICTCCLLGLPISHLAPRPTGLSVAMRTGRGKECSTNVASEKGLTVCLSSDLCTHPHPHPKPPSHIQKGWWGIFLSSFDPKMPPVLETWGGGGFGVTVSCFFSQPHDPAEMLHARSSGEHWKRGCTDQQGTHWANDWAWHMSPNTIYTREKGHWALRVVNQLSKESLSYP